MNDLLLLALFFVGGGLLLIAISIPLIQRRVKPNSWYGFRTPTTLSNEAIWYDANAYAGRWLLAVGTVGLVTAIALAFVPGIRANAYAWIFLIVFGIAMAAMVIASFRYLNRLKTKFKELIK